MLAFVFTRSDGHLTSNPNDRSETNAIYISGIYTSLVNHSGVGTEY